MSKCWRHAVIVSVWKVSSSRKRKRTYDNDNSYIEDKKYRKQDTGRKTKTGIDVVESLIGRARQPSASLYMTSKEQGIKSSATGLLKQFLEDPIVIERMNYWTQHGTDVNCESVTNVATWNSEVEVPYNWELRNRVEKEQIIY